MDLWPSSAPNFSSSCKTWATQDNFHCSLGYCQHTEEENIPSHKVVILGSTRSIYNINTICILHQDLLLWIISGHNSKWFSHPGFIGVVLRQEWCTELSKYINLLKPTGYVMHHQFNTQQLYALSTLYVCVLYLSENKQRLVPLTA